MHCTTMPPRTVPIVITYTIFTILIKHCSKSLQDTPWSTFTNHSVIIYSTVFISVRKYITTTISRKKRIEFPQSFLLSLPCLSPKCSNTLIKGISRVYFKLPVKWWQQNGSKSKKSSNMRLLRSCETKKRQLLFVKSELVAFM